MNVLAEGGNQIDVAEFQKLIWKFYRSNKRAMPWRETHDPYLIAVSEVMLQQTQVSRVIGKYTEFVELFPDWEKLAEAPVAEVIRAWQGLGYNRRALNLQRAAQMVMAEYGGELPQEPMELVKLPGIGVHTAGSIAAFAFNYQSVFIETNIRRVFIHHFFGEPHTSRISALTPPVRAHRRSTMAHLRASGSPGTASRYEVRGTNRGRVETVSDRELLPLVEAALDRGNPRAWYWALMDYGAYLARVVPNPNRLSKQYSVQSKFEGSDRQLRGLILRTLSGGPSNLAGIVDLRKDKIVEQLIEEGFVAVGDKCLRLR